MYSLVIPWLDGLGFLDLEVEQQELPLELHSKSPSMHHAMSWVSFFNFFHEPYQRDPYHIPYVVKYLGVMNRWNLPLLYRIQDEFYNPTKIFWKVLHRQFFQELRSCYLSVFHNCKDFDFKNFLLSVFATSTEIGQGQIHEYTII